MANVTYVQRTMDLLRFNQIRKCDETDNRIECSSILRFGTICLVFLQKHMIRPSPPWPHTKVLS